VAQVDLTKCDQVARRELAYLHDLQMLMQIQIKFMYGETYYQNNVFPKLTKEVKTKDDYLELP